MNHPITHWPQTGAPVPPPDLALDGRDKPTLGESSVSAAALPIADAPGSFARALLDLDTLTPAARADVRALLAAHGLCAPEMGRPPAAPALPSADASDTADLLPFDALLKCRRRLGRAGSSQPAVHVELDLSETPVAVQPGDAIGILPENDPILVQRIIAHLGLSGRRLADGESLRAHLLARYDIDHATPDLFQLIATLATGERRDIALALRDASAPAMDVLSALGLLSRFRPSPEALLACLAPLEPRFHLVTSSARLHPGIAALVVEKEDKGSALTFLSTRAPVGSRLQCLLRRAPHFRLPQQRDVPLIMIGAGVGIAPFRAFLQDRRARMESGPAWLFFSHASAATDYFYEDELRAFRAQGHLTTLTTAWTQSGPQAGSLEGRLAEAAPELLAWISEGAHVYVCGDDVVTAGVERTMVGLLSGHMALAGAGDLDALKAQDRYHIERL